MPYVEMSAKSNYNYELPFLLILRKLANDPALQFTQAPTIKPSEINLTQEDIL